MKTNKTIVGFSIVLALACVFQLSFTWKAQGFEKEAKAFAAKVADADILDQILILID